MTRPDPAARHRAREAALQMLYQSEIGRTGAHDVIVTFWPAHDPEAEIDDDLRTFANTLVHETVARLPEIDPLIAARAHNWRVERMAVIDRLVLRLAVAELLTQPATPAVVVINEAIELARTFSGDDAVPFVNGILDAVRKDLRRDQND
jgi:N utilization substance protein B